MDPKQLAPVLSNVTASADKLAACPTVKEALAAILRDEKITLADQIAITEVEAPPFHEDERAKDLMRRFQALGLTDVTIDQEGNVIARRPGTGNGPTLVLGAHLDTVFLRCFRQERTCAFARKTAFITRPASVTTLAVWR